MGRRIDLTGWLKAFLTEARRPVMSTEVETACTASGYNEWTLREKETKEAAGAKSKKYGSAWYYYLPPWSDPTEAAEESRK